MEVPALKIANYQRRPKVFAQQLGEALETVGVAQVDGLEQQLIDDLYGKMQEHIDEIPAPNPKMDYLGRRFRRQTFYLNYYGIRNVPGLNVLVKKIKKVIPEIGNKISSAAASLYGQLEKSQDLILFRYYKGQGLTFRQDKLVIQKHTDDKSPLTFAASASAPGLEGRINCRWTPLQPNPGHLLVWPGDEFESISDGRVKALQHRVQYPSSERWVLLYA